MPFDSAHGRKDTFVLDVPALDLVRDHTLSFAGELIGARLRWRGVFAKKAGQLQWRECSTAEGRIGAISSSITLGPFDSARHPQAARTLAPQRRSNLVKLFIVLILLCLLSAAVVARDLSVVAKKERERRQAAEESRGSKKVLSFTNEDLKRYRQTDAVTTIHRRRSPKTLPQRDFAKERAFWAKEKVRHENELARLNARIRRLEWRLAERKARRRPGERLREDPGEKVLEQTLEALRQERKKLIEDFRERGRRARALPGWLR